jgi:hypothetical protein
MAGGAKAARESRRRGAAAPRRFLFSFIAKAGRRQAQAI